MKSLFDYSNFQGDISQWNFKSLINSEFMFDDCKNSFIPDWANLDKESLEKLRDSIQLKQVLEQSLNSRLENKKLKI